jgi:hypothetical protein
MSRNGSGTYSLPSGNPVVTGTVISSTWANNTLNDIASALTTSIASDGQTPITANLPMSGYRLTGLGAGANPGDSVRYEQIFPLLTTGTVAGTGGTLTIGGASGDLLNLTGTAVSTGASLSVNSGLLFIDNTNSRVGVGTTSPAYTAQVNGTFASGAYVCRAGASGAYRANTFNIDFVSNIPYLYIDTSNLGQISIVSDRRIKKDIQDLEGAVQRVMMLRPVAYSMRSIGMFQDDGMRRSGFIADELQEVIPSAVFGDKDALTSDGQIQPQSLNLAPIIAELTAALQYALQEIAVLKAK